MNFYVQMKYSGIKYRVSSTQKKGSLNSDVAVFAEDFKVGEEWNHYYGYPPKNTKLCNAGIYFIWWTTI